MKIIVVSTPKTGNTWMTHLLSAVYSLPEVELPPVFDPVVTAEQGPDWVALQHYYPEPDLLAWAKQHQVLFVTMVRHPGDLLVSLWHMIRNKGYPSSADLGLSTMLLNDGDQMGKHTTQYVTEDFYHGLYISLDWMKSGQSFIVRYEDLWRDPVETLIRLTGSIQPVAQDRIEGAIDLCDLGLLRKLYNDPEGKFYRKGGPGNWRDELPDAVVDVFHSHEPYPTLFCELGYTLDPQDPLIDAPAKPRVSTNPFLKNDRFDNGVRVPMIAVKRYLLLDSAFKARWSGGETATSNGSFFAWLNAPVDKDPQRQGPLPVITNLAHYIYRQRPDLREAFPDVFGKDRIDYVLWFVRHAAAEYDLDQAFITPVQGALLAWGNVQAAPTLTNLALHIYHMRPELQAAFPDVFGADRTRFANWFANYAQTQDTSDRVLVQLAQSSARVISQGLPKKNNILLLAVSSLRHKISSMVKRASFWITKSR